MNRRTFIKRAGICTSVLTVNGSFLSRYLLARDAVADILGTQIQKPIDTEIRIKPICSARVHLEAYEGPCRSAPLERLTTEAEDTSSRASCDSYVANLQDLDPRDGILLESSRVTYPEGDIIDETFWNTLDPQVENIDLFVTSYRVPGLERYRKPIAMIGRGVTNVDVAAYHRSIGIEGYAPYDLEDFDHLVTALKVKKAMSQTKVLVLSNRIDHVPYGVYSSITDYDHLREKYGVIVQSLPFDELAAEMESVLADTALTTTLVQQVSEFVESAEAIHMDTDTIINDFAFYASILRLLEKHEANAFSVRCFELCGSQIPWQKKFIPCSTLSLLKDHGIPAGCEGDMNALLAMATQMYLSRKSVFMGNPTFDRQDNLMYIHHDVPGLKMKGLSEPDLPFEIVNFASTGFGATVRYDFAKDAGQVVTFSRFDPSGNKLLVTTGHIEGCYDMRRVGCAMGITVKVRDAMEIFEHSKDFGHHLAMVYGDYAGDIEKMGSVMDVDVVKC